MVRIPESRLLIPRPGFNPWIGNAAQSKKKKNTPQTEIKAWGSEERFLTEDTNLKKTVSLWMVFKATEKSKMIIFCICSCLFFPTVY